MKKVTFVCFLIIFGIHDHVSSQVTQVDKSTDVNWSIFWNGSLTLQSDVFNRKKLTLAGLGTSARKVFSSGIGIESKLSYRNWSDFDMTVVPLLLGPSYTISSTSKSTFLVRTGVGPELILGNDYASVFAGFEIGPELQIKMNSGSAMVFGFDLAQAMSFHPNSFEYLDVYVGWQF